jgi:hypothetical protein
MSGHADTIRFVLRSQWAMHNRRSDALESLDALLAENNRLLVSEAAWAAKALEVLAENQQLRDALRRIATHDLHVDYADCELRMLARRALAAVGDE